MAEITSQARTSHHQPDEATMLSIENQKLGMWLYLGSEVVIFSILIAGYVIFRINNADSVLLVQDTLGITLVTINTFILLASSYAMVMGLRAMEMGNQQGFTRWIGLTAVMGIIFLGGQFIEYSELRHLGINLKSTDYSIETTLFEESISIEEDGEMVIVDFENVALLDSLALDDTLFEPDDGESYSLASKFTDGSATLTSEEFEHLDSIFTAEVARSAENFGGRFYTPTAFHGAHVLIGVIWALIVLWKGRKGNYTRNAVGIEIFGLYWHFVDVVWILLFTLIYLV
ncbi:MAG: heme-copper oxidase subunit III [Anaerolineae bacterium]|nr:heme-copper oxidase subunit III [Anaerolineae bacterium]MDQ7034606.1 heme-copper oxidase subunit III [Anaerolineae bacterium]